MTIRPGIITALTIAIVSAGQSEGLGGTPTIIVPVQAIRVADDDGGRQTLITPTEVADWVGYANEVFSVAGIGFSFDPNAGDFSDLNSTLLNNVNGTGDANWRAARAYGNSVAAGYPGKLVVFFRWGPYSAPVGNGFSWFDYNFIAMPGFGTYVCGHHNLGLFAHEVGHFLSLPHTFAGIFPTVAHAESLYLAHGRNPFVFDGDGIADTHPDPFIENLDCLEFDSLTLAGDLFPLQMNNVMNYWDAGAETLTPQQGDRVRWLLAERMQFDMAMPSNYERANTQEFDSLPVTGFSGTSFFTQHMAGFGLDTFAHNDHLFCGSVRFGSITFAINVPHADTYDVDVYATRSRDFGIIRFWWDGVRLGPLIDLYAPVVVATDELALGTVLASAGYHLITVEVIARNPASFDYFFGLDAIALEPTGCNCDDLVSGCQSDIGFLATCLTGPAATLMSAVPGCPNLCGDFFESDGDQDVDLADIGFWLRQPMLRLPDTTDHDYFAPIGLPAGDACTAEHFRAAFADE